MRESRLTKKSLRSPIDGVDGGFTAPEGRKKE
jgi:hypothetical protein